MYYLFFKKSYEFLWIPLHSASYLMLQIHNWNLSFSIQFWMPHKLLLYQVHKKLCTSNLQKPHEEHMLWHINPLYLKSSLVFSDGEPHRVLHSCDCCNTPWFLRSTKDVWWVKTVRRSVSQSLEVKTNYPRWTTGRVKWAGSTQCLSTWGPREGRWVVWHCRRVFTTPESSQYGQVHERSIRQALWNMKYDLGIDMICQRQGAKALAPLSRTGQNKTSDERSDHLLSHYWL